MLRAIAAQNDYSKNTLQHIKSVLSGIFTFAKNEGAFEARTPFKALCFRAKREKRKRLSLRT